MQQFICNICDIGDAHIASTLNEWMQFFFYCCRRCTLCKNEFLSEFSVNISDNSIGN